MIVSVYESDDNEFIFTSNGCGCCSCNYYFNNVEDNHGDKQEIIDEIKRNVEVAKEACAILGIDIKTLL